MNNLQLKSPTQPKQYEKPEFERLADEFIEADTKYLAIEENFMNGNILRQILVPGVDPEKTVEEFKMIVEEMKNLLEDRNSKLMLAKNALRAAVQMSENQFRGPDGKASTLNYGPFSVSSVTRRNINPDALLSEAAKRGFLQELMALRGMDKTGATVPLIEPKYAVSYEGVMTWLKQRGLTDVASSIYEEKDGTPMVKGPKKLAFLGEKKEE